MLILIAGASGFVGTALTRYLESQGHFILKLVRLDKDLLKGSFLWDPAKGKIDLCAFEGVDAVINLSGENIFSGRWTKERKQRILDSRVDASQTLVSAMGSLKHPPKVFIQASAIGFYGDGDAIKQEGALAGEGFLPKVCKAWEAAAKPAEALGIRTVIFRFGVVLGADGGMLRTVLPLFKLGLGSRLGSGRQWMSWIGLDDLVSLFQFALLHENISGALNAVSPECVTNAVFTETLCKILRRPQCFPLPAWLLSLVFGKEKAVALLLSSARVEPLKLMQLKYSFLYADLKVALRKILLRQ
jgi:TIGR01777 family protein